MTATLIVLKKLLSMQNKNNKVKGVWRMKRAQVIQAIRDLGYSIVETGTNTELRPLGAKTHVRKKVVKIPR